MILEYEANIKTLMSYLNFFSYFFDKVLKNFVKATTLAHF